MSDFSKYNDEWLIAQICLGGDKRDSVFNEIYVRYSKRLYLYCRSKCEDMLDAEDIHQEIWKFFFEAVNQGKENIQLPHYLFGIARNLIYQNSNKKRKSNLSFVENKHLDMIISKHTNLESLIENNDLIQLVKKVSTCLSEKQKDTFYLKWFADLSNSEIAEITGDSIDAIKQRNYRSLIKILESLEPFFKKPEQ